MQGREVKTCVYIRFLSLRQKFFFVLTCVTVSYYNVGPWYDTNVNRKCTRTSHDNVNRFVWFERTSYFKFGYTIRCFYHQTKKKDFICRKNIFYPSKLSQHPISITNTICFHFARMLSYHLKCRSITLTAKSVFQQEIICEFLHYMHSIHIR